MGAEDPLEETGNNQESTYDIDYDRRGIVAAALGAIGVSAASLLYDEGGSGTDTDLPGNSTPSKFETYTDTTRPPVDSPEGTSEYSETDNSEDSADSTRTTEETTSEESGTELGVDIGFNSELVDDYFFGDLAERSHDEYIQESRFLESPHRIIQGGKDYSRVYEGLIRDDYIKNKGEKDENWDYDEIINNFTDVDGDGNVDVDITDLMVDRDTEEFSSALRNIDSDTADTLEDFETASEWYENNVSTETSTGSEYEPEFEFGKFVDIYDDVLRNGQTDELMSRVQTENPEAFRVVEQAYDVGVAYENSDQPIQIGGDHTVSDESRYMLAGVFGENPGVKEAEVEWMHHRISNNSSFDLPDNPYEDDWSGDGADNETIIKLGRGPNEDSYNLDPRNNYGALAQDQNLEEISVNDTANGREVEIKRTSDINDRTLTTTLDFDDWKDHRDGAFRTANNLLDDPESHDTIRNGFFNEDSLGWRVEEILDERNGEEFENLVVDMHNLATMFPEDNSRVQNLAEKAFSDDGDENDQFNLLESSTALYNIAHTYKTAESEQFDDRNLDGEALDFMEYMALPIHDSGITDENLIGNERPEPNGVTEEDASTAMRRVEREVGTGSQGILYDRPVEVMNHIVNSSSSISGGGNNGGSDGDDDGNGNGGQGGFGGGDAFSGLSALLASTVDVFGDSE